MSSVAATRSLSGVYLFSILPCAQKGRGLSLAVRLDGNKVQANAFLPNMSHVAHAQGEKQLEKEINALMRKGEILDRR